MARLIKVDGSITTISPKQGNKFTLKELQDMVGGYIEELWIGHNELAIFNEEGRLKNMPYNFIASKEVQCALVGDVLICNLHELDY